jgi:ferrous iron transport protein A
MQSLDKTYPGFNYYITQVLESLDDEMMDARFKQLGFVPGVQIKFISRAPILSEPLLVEIRGTQVALSKYEAKKILISKLKDE